MSQPSGRLEEAQRESPLRLFRLGGAAPGRACAGPRGAWGWPWALLALTVLGAVLFRGVLFGGEVFFSRDVAPFFYPMKAFLARSVRHGVLPLWNPWILNGEPFFATLQPGVLYPGSVLFYLLPMPWSFDVTIVLHFLLVGMGTWVLLRRWGRGRPAAALGAVAFMLGGYLVSVANYPNNLQTVAWIPWAWVAWDRVASGPNLRDALLFSLACGVAFLGGEPQMLAVGLGLMFVHALLGIERSEVTRSAAAATFAGAGVLALALVAVQLLPLVELVHHSVRLQATGLDFASRWATRPVNLTQLLLPPALGTGPIRFGVNLLPAGEATWILTLYPGVVVLSLAVVGVARPTSPRWRAFWVGTAVLGLLLAMGTATPLFPALYHALPPLRAVRYPEKFLWLTAVATAVLSARGLDRVLAGDRTRSGVVAAGVSAVLLLGLGVTLVVHPSIVAAACRGVLHRGRMCATPDEAASAYAWIALRGGALAAAAAAVLVLRRAGRIRPALAAAAILLLASADLLAAQDHVNPSVGAGLYDRPPWAAMVLRRLDPEVSTYRYRGSPTAALMGSAARVLRARELSNMYLDYELGAPNTGMVAGIQTQDGLQGIELDSEAEIETTLTRNRPRYRTKMLRAMNVRYYADPTVTADSMPGLVPVAAHPALPIRIFQVADALPRAYVVTEDTLVSAPIQAFGASIEPSFPLERRVALATPPNPRPRAGSRGRVVRAAYGTNVVRLRVETDGPSVLVLTDRYYPGWHATVDGSERPILRANGYFRAVAVPAGSHEVVFRFAPSSVRYGAWISAAALVLWAGLWVAGGRHRGEV